MMKKLALLLIALLAAAAFAQDGPPAIAVYVTGDLSGSEKRVLESEMLNALVRTGQFSPLKNFMAEAEKEGTVGDSLICELGKRLGARAVCIADVTAAFGFHLVAVRLLSVKTGKVLLTGKADGPLNSMQAVEALSNSVVKSMGFTAPVSPAPPASAPSPVSVPPPVSVTAPVSAVTPVSPPPQAGLAEPEPAPIAQMRPKLVEESNSWHAPNPPESGPAAPAKGPTKVAVYVTGLSGPLNNILSKAVTAALVKTNIYAGIESIDQYVSGAANDSQLSRAGAAAGVRYIFVVNVSGQIGVRIVDVGMAAVLAQISIDGQITAINAAIIAKKIVDFILKSGPKPDPADRPAPGPAPYVVAKADAPRADGGGMAEGQRLRKKRITMYTSIGLDVLGAGVLIYGIMEENNVVKHIENIDGPEAAKAAVRRNVAYMIGGTLLASGVAIHVLF